MFRLPAKNQLLYALCTLVVSMQSLPQAQAAILPLTLVQTGKNNITLEANAQKLGYIEYQPNGTLILRPTAENSIGGNMQNLQLFKSVLNAIKLAPKSAKEADPTSKFNIKIYGDGVEHKFPPFLENIIQRIQSYFSVYKYTDTSRPVRQPEVHQIEAATHNTNNNDFYITTTISAATESVEGSGGGSALQAHNFINVEVNHLTEDYPEFIAIGENDDKDFIIVGED